MSIIRTPRPDSYTIVNNRILYDTDGLSWEAIGLLVYLLSKPDYWQVSVTALTNTGRCGHNKINTITKELKEAGYLVGQRNKDGSFDYFIYDCPQEKESLNPKSGIREKMPKSEKPKSEKPKSENRTQVNTESKVNTEYQVNTFSLSSENENLSKNVLSTSKFEPISQPEPESELTNAQKIIMAVVKVQNREMPEQELKILMWAVSGCERNDMHWSNLLSKYPDRFEKYLNGTLGIQYQEFEAKKTRASATNTNTGDSFNSNGLNQVGGSYATHNAISASIHPFPKKLSTAERQLAACQRAIEKERRDREQQQPYDSERIFY